MLKKQNDKDISLETNSTDTLLEKVKRNNMMDWGEIELAESVLQSNTKEQ